jgi:hypothetical protein
MQVWEYTTTITLSDKGCTGYILLFSVTDVAVFRFFPARQASEIILMPSLSSFGMRPQGILLTPKYTLSLVFKTVFGIF